MYSFPSEEIDLSGPTEGGKNQTILLHAIFEIFQVIDTPLQHLESNSETEWLEEFLGKGDAPSIYASPLMLFAR